MNEDNEILDVVDETDTVIGTIKRKDIAKIFEGRAQYIRYSECFIRNTEGKLWIPRRRLNKKIAPGGLDFSASEHVQSGESYLEAAVRGLFEELNLKIDPAQLVSVGKLAPIANRPFFAEIYLVELDESPKYNPEDFSDYEWLTPKDLLAKLEQGVDAKLDLKAATKLLIDSHSHK